MSESVKFPFKVNDKVVAVFREDAIVDLTTRKLIKNDIWSSDRGQSNFSLGSAYQEHPELLKYNDEGDVMLVFNSITGSVKIIPKKYK